MFNLTCEYPKALTRITEQNLENTTKWVPIVWKSYKFFCMQTLIVIANLDIGILIHSTMLTVLQFLSCLKVTNTSIIQSVFIILNTHFTLLKFEGEVRVWTSCCSCMEYFLESALLYTNFKLSGWLKARSQLRYNGNHCKPAEWMRGRIVIVSLFFNFGRVRACMWWVTVL